MTLSVSDKTRAVIEQYSAYWQTLDLEGILSLFDDNIEYYDFLANQKIPTQELAEYITLSFPSSANSAIRYIDRLRVDGDTGFSQYTYVLEQESGQILTYQNAEAITVKDGLIIRINEYSSHIKTNADESPSPEVVKLGLSEDRCQLIAAQLDMYFEQQKPFLKQHLSLADIAAETGYTRNQLSFVFNHTLRQSFYDYLNEARLNYLLQHKTPEQTGADSAFEAGFSSMSTFYKTFKRVTGTTPGKYFSPQ
jgi:AraC-like DNA-binding protein